MKEKENDKTFTKKFVETNEKIGETLAKGEKHIENGVVGGYKKIENGVVGGYKKIEDKFIDKFLRKDGETIEEAKTRLKADEQKRKEEHEKMMEEQARKIESLKK